MKNDPIIQITIDIGEEKSKNMIFENIFSQRFLKTPHMIREIVSS